MATAAEFHAGFTFMRDIVAVKTGGLNFMMGIHVFTVRIQALLRPTLHLPFWLCQEC